MNEKKQSYDLNASGEEFLAGQLSEEKERLEELYGLPVLGVIPQGPGKRCWFRRRKAAVKPETKREKEDEIHGGE